MYTGYLPCCFGGASQPAANCFGELRGLNLHSLAFHGPVSSSLGHRVVKGDEKAQREVRALKVRPKWKEVISAAEGVKGEKWDCFRDRHGDWGRDLALLLGRRECGLKLAELGELCGGLDYRTVGSAVTKAIARVGKHREFQKAYASAQKQLTETEQ